MTSVFKFESLRVLALFAALTVCALPACSGDGDGDGDGDGGGEIEMDATEIFDADRDDANVDDTDSGSGGGDPTDPIPDAGDAATPPEDSTCSAPDPEMGIADDAVQPISPGKANASFPELTNTALEDPEIGRAELISVSGEENEPRTYTLASTAALRPPLDGSSFTSPRQFSEKASDPLLRSGNALFDALFALALEEVRENSVESISDGAFNNGQGVPCGEGGCFETGRNWHYVWTRDTAFAVDLGLAAIDPSRARRSLEFKLSERRGSAAGGGDLQIVQDTGTGGSWPVSTDRVSWAMGASELLNWLDGAERVAFRDQAFAALANTLDHDRATIFDRHDGLYTGEQSFLDWREQTYPAWTADDPAHIAMSKALSTNLLHLNAMRLAAALAREKGDADAEERYACWADNLRAAIRARFRLDSGLLSTFSTTALDDAPTEQFDALSIAFAIDQDVLTSVAAANAVAAYPHTGKGPPTIWPQQQATPIYHNRSSWPFVTAYWVEAARKVGNDRAASFGIWSLVRGAALNLSNMENFELMSGKAWLDDDDSAMSGPVINSQRQLWSVAGYLSMVRSTLFGIEATPDGLRIRPYVPRQIRHSIFGSADAISLTNVTYRGKRIDIELALPPVTHADTIEGAYELASATLNGQPIELDALLTTAELTAHNTIVIRLAEPSGGGSQGAQWTFIPPAEIFAEDGWRKLFGPKAPTIPDLGVYLEAGQVKVTFASGETDTASIVHDIYRDGERVASGLDGAATSWIDSAASADHAQRTHCYSVHSRFKGSNTASQHARPVCYWGAWQQPSWRIQEIAPPSFTFNGGSLSTEHGREHLGNGWGSDGHFVEVQMTAAFDGDHLIQVIYANGTGALNTSVTCGVKQAQVFRTSDGARVAEGYLAFPVLGSDWSIWKESTLLRVRLQKGEAYRIRIGSDDHSPRRAINMSAFRHFESYTGNAGSGGTGGELNHVNIAQIKVLAMGE
ncbi:MAG: hypothetical protein LBM75_02880 [Myxococcales bacterium]|jgi:hypothetical protein|nr:hypothetical protein [Myxococcales bacterium]